MEGVAFVGRELGELPLGWQVLGLDVPAGDGEWHVMHLHVDH